MKLLVLRAAWWPFLAVFSVVARVWTFLGSTGHRRAWRLASSDAARQAGQAAETRLRGIVETYTESTPLVLRLLVVRDHFTRGMADWDFFRPTRAAFRVSCEMHVTAYFSSPLPPAQTLARILDAGEAGLSGVPFTRDTACQYRPGELTHAGHTLTWDQSTLLVADSSKPLNTFRCLYEPSSVGGLSGIRDRYGTVFSLALPPAVYFRMPR